ncbi:hypothetical protein FSARC_569 [Fusarium sarcochroum]|uniref:BZIP domain-containing protein n=1 Tax=Fusarium sarcochroum TaxID=1208366 RepID=A0A8H4XF89_9HYPO|nr:hypothetical protein FSARC_569 [Fusarium sarcochroum]
MRDRLPRNILDARRLKKQESDRIAQRQARERTKNRIKQLELLVSILQQDNNSKVITSLVNDLTKVPQERDRLREVLSSLGDTICRHIDDTPTSELSSKATLESPSYAPPEEFASQKCTERMTPVTTSPASRYNGSPETKLHTEHLSTQYEHVDTSSCDTWDQAAYIEHDVTKNTALGNFVPFSNGLGQQMPLPNLSPAFPVTVPVIACGTQDLCYCLELHVFPSSSFHS